MNTMKTFFLMALLTVLLVLLGNWLGGQGGMMIAFAIALAMNFVSYWFSDKIALSFAGAHPVSEAEALSSLAPETALRGEAPWRAVWGPQPRPAARGQANGRLRSEQKSAAAYRFRCRLQDLALHPRQPVQLPGTETPLYLRVSPHRPQPRTRDIRKHGVKGA